MTRPALGLSALFAAALVAASCGGAGAPPGGSATDAGRTLQIGISDFFFSPASVELVPGEKVTLVLKNLGTMEHTFMAGRGPQLGKGFSEDWLMSAMSMPAGHDMGATQGVRIAPKATATLNLVVPAQAGEFEIGCFVPGHYESGMKGLFVVASGVGGAGATTLPAISSPTARPSATPMGSMGEEDAEAH